MSSEAYTCAMFLAIDSDPQTAKFASVRGPNGSTRISRCHKRSFHRLVMCVFIAGQSQGRVPWGLFFASKPVWAVIVAHFCFNWGYYTLLAWLPSYFELSLGLNVESSSLLTLIPYIAMTCMTPFVGPVADGLVQNGWKVTNVRKLAQVSSIPLACPISFCGLGGSSAPLLGCSCLVC
jgi:hypothetical protein